MRFITKILAGLTAGAVVYASEYPTLQGAAQCMVQCFLEAENILEESNAQGQAPTDFLSLMNLLCGQNNPSYINFLGNTTVCLGQCMDVDTTPLLMLESSLCQWFEEVTNYPEPEATYGSFSSIFTQQQNMPTMTSAFYSPSMTQEPVPFSQWSVTVPNITPSSQITFGAKPTQSTCENGTYRCVESGKSDKFTICTNGRMITQSCSPGTVCKSMKNSIICDWA